MFCRLRSWDSGRVASGEQAFVAYAGPALAPDTAYRWTVQSWPATGGPSPLAPHATFETGIGDHDWKAKWISRAFPHGPGRDVYTYARTEFTLASLPIVRARAYVSGDQQYELYLNGTRAGKGQAYSFPDAQYYETLDVTSLLRRRRRQRHRHRLELAGPDQGPPGGQAGRDRPDLGSARRRHVRARRHRRLVEGCARGRGWRARSATSRVTSSTSPRTSTGAPSPWAGRNRDSTTARGPGPRCSAPPASRPGATSSRCAPASWRSPSRR